MIYKTIDLCAGIGGIRRGFELTHRFENVLSAEIDSAAALTYKHLFGEDPTNDLTSEEFKKTVDCTEYDVLLAGFPCQAFSRVGKQLGFRDTTRGTIFFDIADIISRTHPRAVFLENVENLLFHDKGNTIATIIKTLEDELDYRVIGVTIDEDGNYQYDRTSFVRNSKDFGVPQNRPRVYIMAFSKKMYGNAVKMLNSQLPMCGKETIFPDIRAVLETDVDDEYYMAEGYLETLKRHKVRQENRGYGFGYCVLNDTEEEHPIAHTLLATGGSGKERNLIRQPKAGVSGKHIIGRKTPLNSEGIRVMTPKEWGRLQGFIGYAFLDENGIDRFSFPEGITKAQKYKQFGNSVSVPVIKTLAEYMIECFELLEKQQAEIIRALIKTAGCVSKKDIMDRLDVNAVQASQLLKPMIDAGELIRLSHGKSTRYAENQPCSATLAVSQEEKVLAYAQNEGIINTSQVQSLLGASRGSINVLLSVMTKKHLLIRIKRGSYAIPKSKNNLPEE